MQPVKNQLGPGPVGVSPDAGIELRDMLGIECSVWNIEAIAGALAQCAHVENIRCTKTVSDVANELRSIRQSKDPAEVGTHVIQIQVCGC